MKLPRFVGFQLHILLCTTIASAQSDADSLDWPIPVVDTIPRGQGGLFPELGFFSAVDPNGVFVGPVRFSPLGVEGYVKEDISNWFGYYGGAGWRHVGFLRTVPDTSIQYKYRTWNFSLSAGVTLGSRNGSYLFTGMTLDIPFHYRERRFEGGNKVDAYGAWFSGRTYLTAPALVLGYRTPYQVSVKFMYYLNSFFRPRSLEDSRRVHLTDSDGFNPQVVSVSVQIGLFQKDDPPRYEVFGGRKQSDQHWSMR
ncbi:MAG: hypothetical protein JNM62_14740 [Flavobacteriales bacterium]|nr:hypothetical protein [Flavobacteriales bacterium]